MFHIQFSSQKNHLFVADMTAVCPPRHPESVVDMEHLYWELLGDEAPACHWHWVSRSAPRERESKKWCWRPAPRLFSNESHGIRSDLSVLSKILPSYTLRQCLNMSTSQTCLSPSTRVHPEQPVAPTVLGLSHSETNSCVSHCRNGSHPHLPDILKI